MDPGTVLSLALLSLDKATLEIPVRNDTVALVNATIAENGVWPFRYPLLFKSISFLSMVLSTTIQSFLVNPATSIVLQLASRGLTKNGITPIPFSFNNSSVTIESFPPPTGTITLLLLSSLATGLSFLPCVVIYMNEFSSTEIPLR